MLKNKTDILNTALELVEQKKTYGEIRKFVVSNTSDKENVKRIMQAVDDVILNKTVSKKNIKFKKIIFFLVVLLLFVPSLIYFLQGKGIIVFFPTGGILGYFIFNNFRNLETIKRNSNTRRFKSRF